jgi:hypothetical protein
VGFQMADEIVEFVREHGECLKRDIVIEGIHPLTVESRLRSLASRGLLVRTKKVVNGRRLWFYSVPSLAQRLFNEPDWCFHLRNMPRVSKS